MAPVARMEHSHHQGPMWGFMDNRQRSMTGYGHHWPSGAQMQVNAGVFSRDMEERAFATQHPYSSTTGPAGRPLRISQEGPMGREMMGEPSPHIGRRYTIKRCQGFVRCDMDIDAEVVGWVIGKNGSTIKDMKHKTGCNMWVDQRALKLTITGPDLASVEHAAKSVEAYVAAAPIKAGAVEAAVTTTLECPPHLLDLLGDRATIARIVKETHAQVVVNKKIGRIIVRGDPRAVELARGKVQATIYAALNTYGSGPAPGLEGTLPHVGSRGMLVPGVGPERPSSGVDHGVGQGGYYVSGPSAQDGRLGLEAHMGNVGVGGMPGSVLHMMQTAPSGSDFHTMDLPSYHGLRTYALQQRCNDTVVSDTEDSLDPEEESGVSTGSIGIRTPLSSAPGSPRGASGGGRHSLTASPASATPSTPGGDTWSLFSGGFGLGMAALQEATGSSSATTPATTPVAAAGAPSVSSAAATSALSALHISTTTGLASPPHLATATAVVASATAAATASASGVLTSAAPASDTAVPEPVPPRVHFPDETSVGLSAPVKGGEEVGAEKITVDSGVRVEQPHSPSSSDASIRGQEAHLGDSTAKSLTVANEMQAQYGIDGEVSDDAVHEGGERVVNKEVIGGEDMESKVARLGELLQGLGLGKYCGKFADNEVDMEALGLMSEGDLADIGIPKGPRLKILNAVGRPINPAS